MIEPERLQRALDEITDAVEWGHDWIAYLEEHEVRVGTSDLAILKAQLERLRVVADAVAPGRLRDPRSGRRFYVTEDDVLLRARELERDLERAEREVGQARAEVEAEREAEKRRDRRHKRQDEERERRAAADRERVREFLRANGPATAAQIAAETGLTSATAQWIAQSIATRTRNGRFTIREPGAGPRADETDT